ncbi:MAG TPA: deoxyribose-phosphate aldolase [Bryobacteraceae bacterium]|nr:deoxyribose-phosphate aldolase [Bryobacteraceae bacterium]
MPDANIASLIDHTLLRPDATPADIGRLCAEARKYGFAAVCVNPCWVKLAAAELDGSRVNVCTVVGFPLGANATETKVFETRLALERGAREIDTVINIGELKGKNEDAVSADLRAVVETAHAKGAIVKAILETSLLHDTEKIAACRIAELAGAAFVKTSTGFGPGGATVEDVALLRRAVGPRMGVKASGGIRTLADLEKMVAAGASRIGASASVRIMQEATAQAKAGAPA